MKIEAKKMNVAVIGCGYWGRHIIRNFNTSNSWNVLFVCDIKQENLDNIKQNYPNIEITTDYDLILNSPEIDAIIIATPVFTHYELAKKALLARKHTWVEKPLTSTSAQAEELIELAKKNSVLLHVDHTFIYTSAVRKIKEIIDSGDLGDVLYFDSVRINLGLFQHDINVIWDLAPHDFSILQYCINKKPTAVNATGKSLFKYGSADIESIAYVTVHFEDDTLAHFHVNWTSPVKIRQIIIGGTKKMLVYDDMEQIAKLKIYDSGVTIKSNEDIYNALIQYRTGDMHSPAIANIEALQYECEHFYESISSNTPTLTPGESGLYVVKILEAANQSLAENGKLIEL